jgi:hypothetical protein
MTNAREPLLVQVFLWTAVVKGVSPLMDRHRRLADVLNAGDEYLELESATLSLGDRTLDLATVAIEKREIVAAIPWESEEQRRQRQVVNLAGKTKTNDLAVIVYAPPYTIEGSAHFSEGKNVPKTISARASLFSRFFPLSNARIIREDGKAVRSDIVVVNRELAAAIGRPRQVKTA